MAEPNGASAETRPAHEVVIDGQRWTKVAEERTAFWEEAPCRARAPYGKFSPGTYMLLRLVETSSCH